MEQASNPSPMDHSGFAPQSVPGNNSRNHVEQQPLHHHVAPSLAPYPSSAYVRGGFGGSGDINSREQRQSAFDSSEAYPKASGYVTDAYGESYSVSADGVVNYTPESSRTSLPPKKNEGDDVSPPSPDGFRRGSGGGGEGGGEFLPKDGSGGSSSLTSITDERSSKKSKRGGWWHDEEGLDGPSADPNNSSSKEMQHAEVKTLEGNIVGSFVGQVGGLGSLHGAGVSPRGLNVAGGGGSSAVAGMRDGCEDSSVNVEGVVVGVVRGVMNTDGEAVGIGGDLGDVGGQGGSCGPTGGIDGDLGDDGDAEGRDGDSRDAKDKDGIGKKKRAELWQDPEMDALVSAYRQIHMKLAVAGKKGKHVFKSANEKWKEVRNLLLPLGVDRQPKEIERKWSNLSTAFKQIADWNKKVGRPNYWDLDELSKKEKTKAKELPATFRVQLYEAMAEFLGDRTAARRVRGWNHYESGDRPMGMGGSGNGGPGCTEVNSGTSNSAD
jgi:hypothetical protein